MFKHLRRIAVPFAALLLVASFATPALAQGTASFSMEIQQKATLNSFMTVVTVYATYTCTEPEGGIDPNNSGIGGQVTQIVSRNRVVTGGGGLDPNLLVCDGNPQYVTFEIQANSNNQPAAWKKGKAAGSFGGGVCNVDQTDCAGANVDITLRFG